MEPVGEDRKDRRSAPRCQREASASGCGEADGKYGGQLAQCCLAGGRRSGPQTAAPLPQCQVGPLPPLNPQPGLCLPPLKVPRPSPRPRTPVISRPLPGHLARWKLGVWAFRGPHLSAPPGPGPVRGGVRGRGGAAEAGLPFSPLPGPSPFLPEAPDWPDRKGLESCRLGSPSHGLAPGHGRCPRHRPAGPRAQPWETWCCGPGTRLRLPRARRPVPGAVP